MKWFWQILKIRRTIKAIKQFRKTLPFLAAEVTKELEFVAEHPKDEKSHKRCKEVCIIMCVSNAYVNK